MVVACGKAFGMLGIDSMILSYRVRNDKRITFLHDV